jgi:hypothetical protein
VSTCYNNGTTNFPVILSIFSGSCTSLVCEHSVASNDYPVPYCVTIQYVSQELLLGCCWWLVWLCRYMFTYFMDPQTEFDCAYSAIMLPYQPEIKLRFSGNIAEMAFENTPFYYSEPNMVFYQFIIPNRTCTVQVDGCLAYPNYSVSVSVPGQFS